MSRLAAEAFANRMQRQIYNLLRSFDSCDQQCLARFGITASQGYALLAFPAESAISMNELSQAMGLANSTMTRMVDTLVAKVLVHRRQDHEDRRVVRVALTAQGRELQGTLEAARLEMLRQILGDIQEQDWPNISQALEKLNAAVEKAVGGCCGS